MSGGGAPELLGLESNPPKLPRRANGWEIALWVIGIVLLGGSGALVYYFVQLIYGNSQGRGPSDVGVLAAFVQASSIYTPGLVTGGVVCIALALYARARDVNATRQQVARRAVMETTGRRSSAATERTEVVADQSAAPAPSTAVAKAEGPAKPDEPVKPAEPADYSPFMRPTDG